MKAEELFQKKTYMEPIKAEKRYLMINKRLKKVRFPKFIKREKNILFFENIEGHKNLYGLIKKNKKIPLSLYNKIGRTLAKIHIDLNKSKLEHKIMLHGDFWNQNILLKNETIFIIDFEPPKKVKNTDYYLYNFKELDLAKFIFKLKYFTYLSNPFVLLNKRKKEITEFIKGYEKELGEKVSQQKIDIFLKQMKKDELSILQKNTLRNNILKIYIKYF